jgi:L-lactate dehydrogenase complex protein LldG
MKESTSREQILTKIRNALIDVSDIPYPDIDMNAEVFVKPDISDGMEVVFAQELLAVGGRFVYIENEKALLEFLHDLIQKNDWPAIWCPGERMANLLKAGNIASIYEPSDNFLVGLTTCEKLIAQTGSIVVSSADSGGRQSFAFPDVHLVLAYSSQVVLSLKEAINELKIKYSGNLPSQITVITGPSRTADIEKTLVMGAHGPRELYVFMIDDL